MKLKTIGLAAAALVVLCAPAGAGERAKAEVSCAPTERQHVYDCMIMLSGRKSGKALDGAELVIGADMPSMPMAHNVRPVTAEPGAKPGMYMATIELEMHGEWALTLNVAGPTRDRVIHKMYFGDPDSADAAHGMKHGEMKGEMSHGEMKQDE